MGIFEETVVPAERIVDYIPQRAPIVMVDRFLGIVDNVSASELTITEDNLFCTSGVLDECGIIEHIAQSAALRVGYQFKSQGLEIPLGYIGSINKFTLYLLPEAGSTLRTEIRVEHEVMNISLISATVTTQGNVVAECTMKIYLQK